MEDYFVSRPGQPCEEHGARFAGPTASTAEGADGGVCAATPFLEWGITFKTLTRCT